MSMIDTFAQLHQSGNPIRLYNVWDAGSAKAVERAGAKAVATGSLSVAGAMGFGDGEKLPLEAAIENAKRIVSAVKVPVSIDFETGYALDIKAVSENVTILREIGVSGINVEDQNLVEGGLRDVDAQVQRIKAAADTGIFVNARTGLFIQTPKEEHNKELVKKALDRCKAYADFGAKCFFIPFAFDENIIGEICEKSGIAVNVMMLPDSPSPSRMIELGVSRLSYGPGPWKHAMTSLEESARNVFSA